MVYVFLIHNFELVEALGTVDILRRGKLDVTTVSITDRKEVMSSSGVTVMADQIMQDCDFNDLNRVKAFVLPGGPGTAGYLECHTLCNLVYEQYKRGGLVAAICAAPGILDKVGIKVKSTIYPAMKEEIKQYVGGKVVRDGNVITGEAMGATLDFGLEILKYLVNDAAAEAVAISIAK